MIYCKHSYNQGVYVIRRITLRVKLWIKPVFMKTRHFWWKCVVIVFSVKWGNGRDTCMSIFLCVREPHAILRSYFCSSTAVTMGVAVLTQIVLDLIGQQLSPPLLGKFVICRVTGPELSSNMWIVAAFYCFAAWYECCFIWVTDR
jgi:hypothetical protein